MRKQFLVRRYFDIIRDILRSATKSEPFRFEPELVVASIQDPLLREHAAHVVSRVREAHVPVISQAVQRAYARELDKVPQYLRTGLEEAIRHQFLLEQYIPIISSIVSRADVPSAFTWEPPFAIETLSEEAARQSARELCLLVGPQHVPLMEKRVAERFGADTARIDPSIVALHAETLRANWMRENYFGLLREVICGAARTSPVCYDFGSLREVSSSATRSAPSSVFASPKKRARSVAPLRPSEAELLVKIVQQLHTQDLSGSDSVKLTAVVLNHSEELRWTTVTDRMTKAQSQVPIVSVMLADSSGPILLDLWRDCAENDVVFVHHRAPFGCPRRT